MERKKDTSIEAVVLADHTPLILLHGNLDETYAAKLLSALQEASPWKSSFILVDFQNINQVTPSGLRALLPIISQFQAKMKKLVLFNLKNDIQEIVSGSGFDSLVVIKATLQDALQYVKQPTKQA